MTITDDEIRRLRGSEPNPDYDWVFLFALRMADELERLRKENAGLGRELKNVVELCEKHEQKLAKAREDLKYLRKIGECVTPESGAYTITTTIDKLLKEISE